jgi:hypothetical protein
VTGTIRSTGDMTASNFNLSSDQILKQNISSLIPDSLDIDYKTFNLISNPEQLRYGVIAQEIQDKYPELIRQDKEGMLSVAYIDLLIREISYLKAKIKELEKRI